MLTRIIPTISNHFNECAKIILPQIGTLVENSNIVEVASTVTKTKEIELNIYKSEQLLEFLKALESKIRDEIVEQSTLVMKGINTDIQKMWAILHPNELIDEIRLYQPEETPKAIDIALRFHGKEQLSPRLTLSEGHRNSLGLCVFFALYKKNSNDFPLVLDDVVTSFDREHRGFVADLLISEFSDTQVLLFTHDYEWYTELVYMLPRASWAFKSLRSWDKPETGIHWNEIGHGLEAAFNLIDLDLMAAANRARATMDVQMAIISEKLFIPVPFIRGPKNDRRHAYELLDRFVGRANKKLRVKDDEGKYVTYDGCIDAAQDAKQLLVAWSNPATHGIYITKMEVTKLIETCKLLLRYFACPACDSYIWHMVVEGQHLRCDCDKIRWNDTRSS